MVIYIYNPFTNNLDAVNDTSGFLTSVTLNGDVGSATGSTFTIDTGVASNNSGSSFEFMVTGSTLQLNVSDAGDNIFLGQGAGNASNTAVTCVGLGAYSLPVITSGFANSALGFSSLNRLTIGNYNTCVGYGSGNSLITGSSNILIGPQAGTGYTGAESNNIVIQSIATSGGVTQGESNVIRLGFQGSSAGQQNKCFIAGIVGVTASNPVLTTINTSTGQLGVIATANNGVLITSNSGVPSLLANSGTPGFALIANSGAPPSWQPVASFSWSAVTGNVTNMTVNTGYFVTSGPLTLGLPATATIGQSVQVCLAAGTSWQVTQATGQQIFMGANGSGAVSTTSGASGSLASVRQGDWIEIVCVVTNTTWQANVKQGDAITVV